MVEIDMVVDGRRITAEIEERMLLIDFLRDVADAKGVRNGCLEARCGCCAVLVDGRSVKSCNLLALQVAGSEVTTVAGLRKPDAAGWGAPSAAEAGRTELQEAFIRHGAVQCGFCTSGMLMVLSDALDHREITCEGDVRESIRGNLCRCTGYQKIVEAALDVAQSRNAKSG